LGQLAKENGSTAEPFGISGWMTGPTRAGRDAHGFDIRGFRCRDGTLGHRASLFAHERFVVRTRAVATLALPPLGGRPH
jgi:hypothetical protein